MRIGLWGPALFAVWVVIGACRALLQSGHRANGAKGASLQLTTASTGPVSAGRADFAPTSPAYLHLDDE